MRVKNILTITFLVGMMISCTSDVLYSKVYAIAGGWNKDDVKEFLVPVEKSQSIMNIYFIIRNNNSYPFSNLFLLSKLTTPQGVTEIDTLEYKMAKPNGEWLGRGLGPVKENILLYKENMNFKTEGIYKVEVSHALRKNGKIDGIKSVEGIMDVGIIVESAHPQKLNE